jgi:hypothetical protein
MRTRRRPLPDDDVELVIFKRGVKLLFEDGLHPVYLVKKQHLAFAQVRQNRGEVTLDLQCGPRSLLETHIELIGDDGARVVLPNPGGPNSST